MARRRVLFPVCAGVAAAIAGGVALAGILYESGVRTPRLERYYLSWGISSDGLAERGYERLAGGDRAGALELFRLAVRRDPASPYRWCDYAEAMLAAGEREGARERMRRGVELGPYIGPILMRGVNFAYRTGDGAGALAYGKRLLAITGHYDGDVFRVWEGMETPVGSVVERGIPDGRAAQAYHRNLMARGGAGVKASWEAMRRRGFADDRVADEHAGFLLRRGEAGEALRAWAEHAGGREPGYPGENAIFNGGFERAAAGGTFDWRTDAAEGASAERDGGMAAEGGWSLRLRFDGRRNVRYGHVSQRAVVEPGGWRLEARMRTEGVTTNEGLGLRVFDAEAPGRLDIRTERLNGTHEWTTLGARFDVPAGTRVVTVQIVRNPSLKFDNKLGGTAWVDAVSLRRERR